MWALEGHPCCTQGVQSQEGVEVGLETRSSHMECRWPKVPNAHPSTSFLLGNSLVTEYYAQDVPPLFVKKIILNI